MNKEEWTPDNAAKIQVEEVDFIELRKIEPTNCLVLFTFKRTAPDLRAQIKTEQTG